MENIRMAILDTADRLCSFMDNDAPEALHYYNDELHEYLKGSAYSFKFSCSAKHEDSQYIVEGNKIAFREEAKQKDYYLNIVHIEKDEYEIRAECLGLLFELLNEDIAPYEATSAMTFEQYYQRIEPEGSTVIGINEVSDKSIKHEWTGTETVLARLYSLATVFSAEIEFVVELNDNYSLGKVVANVYREHSENNQGIGDYRSDITLRYGKEITGITKTSDITNLYTAIRPTGKDGLKITNLVRTEYDENGNIEFFSPENDDSIRAVQACARYPSNLTKKNDGYIMRVWSYDTDNVEMLYGQALAELKKICVPEYTYEVEGYIDAGIGDVVNIVDEEYNPPLYLQARITEQVRSFTDPTINTTTFSNVEEIDSDIIQELLNRVAELKIDSERVNEIAEEAKEKSENAIIYSEDALEKAQAAAESAENATKSAAEATEKAEAAQSAVDQVEQSVSSIETTVNNANTAAQNAQKAAETANDKADEAKAAAEEAAKDAETALTNTQTAITTAESAVTKAEQASTTAGTAKTTAEQASATANAAKADAEQAEKDILSLGSQLETVSNTMKADYARKTDLTEAKAELQTQITQNASDISLTATRVSEIDETANNAADLASQAQSEAAAAQSKADKATQDATAAQAAADNAAAAAESAQSEADKAKTAASTAQSVADKAKTDLEAAKADLATVTSRVDATEEEITAAQNAVNEAQAAADKAQADADTAAQKAATAQNTANTAVTNASNAQIAADEAAQKAALAQAAADEAKGDATAARQKADEAAKAAATAQSTADTAKQNAVTAQSKADQAAEDAAAAQTAADQAASKAQSAQTDLDNAKKNLEAVTSRVDATEEEVAAAQAAVETAQAAADKAKADAATAQNTANTAKQNAATAQAAADTAQAAADQAQADADEAQKAADKAQADVDALAVRVTTAETKITQNADAIKLAATKTELTETLGGYYTKEQADAAIEVKANEITQTVSNTYATKTELKSTDTKATNAQTAANNAQSAAESAQSSADDAKTNAAAAQSAADTAKANAATAKSAADKAQKDATAAQAAADKAQSDVDALTTRVTTAETKINQNSEAIELKATKTEVEEALTEASTEIHETIVNESASIITKCDGMIFEALKSYTETGDFESFKTAVESQMKLLSDSLSLQFSQTTEQLNQINESLQNQINTITKYFTFDIDGLTIGEVDNPYKIILDNDKYSMTVNDIEVMRIANGEVYTPELTVTTRMSLLGIMIEKDSLGNINFN